MALQFSLFNVEINGVTRRFSDDSVDAWRATLLVRHHFGDGLSLEGQLPTGTVGATSGGTTKRLSGLGDARLALRYDLAALWGAGGYRPSVVVSGGLALPTGQQGRFDSPQSAVPVTVLALGRGAFATHLRVEVTQAAAKWVRFTGWLGADLPLHPNSLGVTNGFLADYGAGVVFLPLDWLQLSSAFRGQTLQSAVSEDQGLLVNSGGTVGVAEASVGLQLGARTYLSLGARAPLFAALSGRQVAETFSTFAIVAVRFGGDDDEDEHDHDHGGGDAHDHGGGDAHDHGGGDAHDHGGGGDKHNHGGGKKHTQGRPTQPTVTPSTEVTPPENTGDVVDIARGGATFVVDDVVVAGRVTVVDFWAEWCVPCGDVDTLLHALASEFPALAVRKVEVPTFDTPVATDHIATAAGLPVIWVYDAERKRVLTLESADLVTLEKTLRELLATP